MYKTRADWNWQHRYARAQLGFWMYWTCRLIDGIKGVFRR